MAIFLIGLFVFFVIKSMFSGPDKPIAPAKTADQTIADIKKEREFQNVVKVAKWAKSVSKNPASFELNFGGLTADGTVCIQFRATNSFNAVVPGRYVMSDTVSGDGQAVWDKHCAGKAMTDYSYARQAL